MLFMKNIDLMENQTVIKDRSHLFLSNEVELPDFKGKNIPFLSNIPENGLADLMAKAKTIRYVKVGEIASEGNTDSLLIIFLGKVKLVRVDVERSQAAMFQIKDPITCFGEIALLTDELRSVSKVAIESTVFATISKKDFNNWLINYIDVKFAFLPVQSEKLDS
jgi:CRP/FNR family transcriptional regulator, cyclic AMP receptor protein